jgi:hypothetical protein
MMSAPKRIDRTCPRSRRRLCHPAQFAFQRWTASSQSAPSCPLASSSVLVLWLETSGWLFRLLNLSGGRFLRILRSLNFQMINHVPCSSSSVGPLCTIRCSGHGRGAGALGARAQLQSIPTVLAWVRAGQRCRGRMGRKNENHREGRVCITVCSHYRVSRSRGNTLRRESIERFAREAKKPGAFS